MNEMAIMLEFTANLADDLKRLREQAELKQSDIATKMGVDQSRISRLETGELVPENDEVNRYLKAVGGTPSKEFGEFYRQSWRSLEKPSFWHPARKSLVEAEENLSRLSDFLQKPGLSTPAKAQTELHRQTLLEAAEYLQSVEHTVAFVGNIGVGKSTAICAMSGLLLPPPEKGPDILSKRTVLETGSSRTTLCEVQLRTEAEGTFGLVIYPHSDEEVFRLVSDFSASLVDELRRQDGSQAVAEDSRGVSIELEKALRNMVGLSRSIKPTELGGAKVDRALELARQCGGDEKQLTAEILRGLKLDQRKQCEFRFQESDFQSGLSKLRQLFEEVNKGKRQTAPLPRRIDVIVPVRFLDDCPYRVGITDTKGVEESALRPDIRAYLDDPRTLTVLCSSFQEAPDKNTTDLLMSLLATGADKVISSRVLLLVLAEARRVLDTQDDEGNRADTLEIGFEIKGSHIKTQLSRHKGLGELPVFFYDAASNQAEEITVQLSACLERMRNGYATRITEVAKAIDELITQHSEEQSAKAYEAVREHLQTFVRDRQKLGDRQHAAHERMLVSLRMSHHRTIWATTRRNGSWHSFDVYHHLGLGAAIDAQGRSQDVFGGLDAILTNLLGLEKLSPAHDYLEELRRNIPRWKDQFIASATSAARELFRTNLYAESALWNTCESRYGSGLPYISFVASQLSDWFAAPVRQLIHDAVEQRIQKAWVDYFVLPLAKLSGAEELLANKPSEKRE